MTSNWKLGLGFTLVTVLMWGLLPIALNGVLHKMDPVTVSWYRFSLSALIAALWYGWHSGPTLKTMFLRHPGYSFLAAAGLLGNLIPLGLGGLFIVLGNMMGKVRSNFMFGIRTPWTLSSELSWNKTHRLGGRIMMAVGFITIVASFLLSLEWAFYLLIGGLFLMLGIVVVYSWVIYKDDPEVVRT